MMKRTVLISIVFLLLAPFSIYAFFEDKPALEITAKSVSQVESDYFFYLTVKLTNNTGDWKELNQLFVELDEEIDSSNVIIVSGMQFVTWGEAVLADGPSTLSLLFSSSFLTTFTNLTQSVIEGKTVISSGSKGIESSLTVKEFASLKNNMDRSKIFPSDHLLSRKKLFVPPGLSVKRNILINVRNPEKTGHFYSFNLGFTNKAGELVKQTVEFRQKKSPNGPIPSY